MIAEAIIGGTTLVVMGCIWLSGKVLDWSYEQLPPNLYEFVDVWYYCPLCGRGWGDANGKAGTTRKFGDVTAKRGYFHVRCNICNGEFDMKVKKEPPKDDEASPKDDEPLSKDNEESMVGDA